MAQVPGLLKVDVNRGAFERIRTVDDLLVITGGDLRGPVLTRVAQTHRKQESKIFTTEGAAGGTGAWPRLSPLYAKWKRKHFPNRKILVRTGDTKDRFLKHGRAENVEEFVQTGPTTGKFRLGARSKIAGYHFRGAGVLPRRDPVTKSKAQVDECWAAIVRWYQKERLPQAFKALRKFGARLTSGGPIAGGAPGKAANPTS